MEFNPKKQEGPSSDETGGDKPEQEQEVMEVNAASAAVLNENPTPQVENVPQALERFAVGVDEEDGFWARQLAQTVIASFSDSDVLNGLFENHPSGGAADPEGLPESIKNESGDELSEEMTPKNTSSLFSSSNKKVMGLSDRYPICLAPVNEDHLMLPLDWALDWDLFPSAPGSTEPEEHWDARKVLDDEVKEESLRLLRAEMKRQEESQKRLPLASATATSEAIQVTMPDCQVVKPPCKDNEAVDQFFGDCDEKLDEKDEIKSSEGNVDKVIKKPVHVSIAAQLQQALLGASNVSENGNDISCNIPEMENVSPTVALKPVDFKREINDLQQQVETLRAMNGRKDGEILKLEMQKRQVMKDIGASNVTPFYFKLQKTENDLKKIRCQFEHVSRNCEKVVKELASNEVALSELSKMCNERLDKSKKIIATLTSNEEVYKARITGLKSRIESFEGFKEEVVKIVSKTNAFIDKEMKDLAKSKETKVLPPYQKK